MKFLKWVVITILLLLFLGITVQAANDTSGNTWSIDTAGVVSTVKSSLVWVYWTNITADGDDLVIKEYPSGNLLLKAKGQGGMDMGWPFPGTSGSFHGINVETLDSGTVLFRMGKPQ